VVDEMQHRLVLALNHVLMQEPQAQARLQRQQGRIILAQWRSFAIKLEATPAGLLDRAKPLARPDLTLTLTQASPFAVAKAAMNGEKPSVSIAGDVQLAAEVNWLVEHVRWDLEDDLSRIIGDAPAHALSEAVRRMASAVGAFVGAAPSEKGGP
jgi:ubiquinone biosynthesis protein UbiJ